MDSLKSTFIPVLDKIKYKIQNIIQAWCVKIPTEHNFFLNLVDCVHVCDFLSSLIPLETRLSLRTCSLLPPPFCFPLTDLNPSIISGQTADSLKRRKQNENLFLNEAEWNINILTEAGYAQNARCQREHRSAWPQTSAWWRQKDLREQQRHVWGQTSRLIWQKAKVRAGWHTSSRSTRAKDRNRGEVCFKASIICKTAQNIWSGSEPSGARTSWVGTAAPGSGTCPFSRPAGSQSGCETSGFCCRPPAAHAVMSGWFSMFRVSPGGSHLSGSYISMPLNCEQLDRLRVPSRKKENSSDLVGVWLAEGDRSSLFAHHTSPESARRPVSLWLHQQPSNPRLSISSTETQKRKEMTADETPG